MIKRLKELRLEKKLSQKEFAARLNITQQTYSDYETGRTNPDIETLVRISDILNVSLDFLLNRSDELGVISINGGETLAEDERKLLEIFRKLTLKNKMHVSAYATVRLEEQERGTRSNIG